MLEGDPERIIKAGEAFWEPGGNVIHYQSANNARIQIRALGVRQPSYRSGYPCASSSCENDNFPRFWGRMGAVGQGVRIALSAAVLVLIWITGGAKVTKDKPLVGLGEAAPQRPLVTLAWFGLAGVVMEGAYGRRTRPDGGKIYGELTG